MIELAEVGDIYIKTPLLDNPTDFRDGVNFFYSDEPPAAGVLEESIARFNKEVVWHNMWTVEDAMERFAKKHVFSYITDSEGVLGYMWHEKNYTYNFFVCKRRWNRDILDFVNMNRYLQKQKGYTHEYLYVTGTNLHVMNLFLRKFDSEVIPEEQAIKIINEALGRTI